MRFSQLTPVLAAAMCSGAYGQTSSLLSLWDHNFRYQVANIVPNGGSYVRTSGALGTGPLSFNGTSVTTGFGPCAANDLEFTSEGDSGAYWACTQHWWWYRGTGDTREYALSNQTAFSQPSPARVVVSYTEPAGGVANALRFDFTYTLTGEAAGADTAYVTVECTVTNLSSVVQNVALFSYTDLTAGGLNSINDQWSYTSYPTHSEFRCNNTLTTTYPFLTTGAIGPVGAQNTRWGSLLTSPTFSRARLSDSSVNDANNLNATSFTSTTEGSWSGSIEFQWPLNPGASASGTVYIGYNVTAQLPAACAADMGTTGGAPGNDGLLDNNDFIVFIDYFFANDARADVGTTGGAAGNDGQFDNNDFIVFIDLFFAGC